MRNIISTWHRGDEVIRKVAYSKVDNAIPKLTYYVMWKGEPGDVIELSHRHTGMQIGTIKVKVGGLQTNWAWD